MRFDLVSIFPSYFAALDLSLLGRAHRDGLVELCIHDLRSWTEDKHRTVDAPPAGGGAGMVMRADIWGKAIDEILGQRPVKSVGMKKTVLAVPTPSGQRLTQRKAESLAQDADHIVVACGRYEGIDSRVMAHYAAAENVEVFEFSLGDYVLNGGEVAALVLVEAVGRLLDGVVGNPDSLVEESHGSEGLLEYPVFTKPPVFQGLPIPAVLVGGDHAKVARWRRDQSLRRTFARRQDLICQLDPGRLDSADRNLLAQLGVVFTSAPQRLEIRLAQIADVAQLRALAVQTFPDACPSFLGEEDICAHLETEFSIQRLEDLITGRGRARVLVAQISGELVGYSLVILPDENGEIPDRQLAKTVGDNLIYLDKCYVRSEFRGTGVAFALVEGAIADGLQGASKARGIVLGTHVDNKRARRFYRNCGFKVCGSRTYRVGDKLLRDVVMVRSFTDNRSIYEETS